MEKIIVATESKEVLEELKKHGDLFDCIEKKEIEDSFLKEIKVIHTVDPLPEFKKEKCWIKKRFKKLKKIGR